MRLPRLRGQNALRKALKILPAIGGLHIDIFNFGGTQIEEANDIPAFVSLHGTNSHTYTKSGTHETWKKLR